MNKKEEERQILLNVYRKDIIEDFIEEGETPDFVICDPANSLKIGVEVTKVYANTAAGILDNDKFLDSFIDSEKDPGFGDDSKARKKKKKKKPEHLKSIKVAKVEGGEELVHKGHVVWYLATIENFFSFLENVISRKTESYNSLPDPIEFVNLIANDEVNFFKPTMKDFGSLHSLLRQHNCFTAIINSNFQEIYFLSELESGKYLIPFKKFLFEGEYYIFTKFWETHNKENKSVLEDKILMLNNFYVCLLHMGFKKLFISGDSDSSYFIYGNSYFKVNKSDFKIEEKEFLCLHLPESASAENQLKNYKNYHILYRQYSAYRGSKNVQFKNGYFRIL